MPVGDVAARPFPRGGPSGSPRRIGEPSGGDGRYPALRDLAAIGDGRTVAIVDRHGTIPWLCLPNLDDASVFGSLLDADRGGAFSLAPAEPYRASRRYVPDTNVLETEFTTASGVVRVTDALTLPDAGLAPLRELCRRIVPVRGRVPMRWEVEPRFADARRAPTFEMRIEGPVVTTRGLALAVRSWGAGDPEHRASSVTGRFVADHDATIALTVASNEPLVFPDREAVERRLDATIAAWREWSARCRYEGRWRDAVVRSALALKLLVSAPSGAVAAAATTSLPESIGGERNWDYRASWVRDAAFTLSAFLRLGYEAEAEAYVWWLMHASQLTHPRLEVLYRLDGGVERGERVLPWEGYRGSRPIRVGNAAVEQVQLDIYGSLMRTAWVYVTAGGVLDAEVGRRLARIADLVCERWREPDSGIWEVRGERLHFTQSKMLCWVALDRAVALASAGHLDGSIDRWRAEMDAIERFVDARCWSAARGSYTRSADREDLDAAVLLGGLCGYRDPRDPRMRSTIEAVGRGLRRGRYLDRYRADDGLAGDEGAFLACSFWHVEALAATGRIAEAERSMDELVASANDVGLFAEEIDPATGEFLGNVPQGLTHLALIGAALAIEEARR
jgi:GH15 family glucan-1,4-alpha-glucosidase